MRRKWITGQEVVHLRTREIGWVIKYHPQSDKLEVRRRRAIALWEAGNVLPVTINATTAIEQEYTQW